MTAGWRPRFPVDVTRRERSCLLAAFVSAPDDGDGVAEVAQTPIVGGPASAMRTIADVLDARDRRSLKRTLVMLERREYVRRGGQPCGTRIWLILPRFCERYGGLLTHPCQNCGRPCDVPGWTPGRNRFCRKCVQVLGRPDRAWQPMAVRMLVEGKSPPEIAVAVGVPLWKSEMVGDDGRAQGGAVVPFLARYHGEILAREWHEALARVREGGSDAGEP